MNNNKIRILFIPDKSKTNQQSKCPLKCRITYLSKRKVFSTGLFINPEQWNNKKQSAEPPNSDTKYINTQLSLIKNNIHQAFLFLQVNETSFDVEDIYLKYTGKNITNHKTLLEVFTERNNAMEKLLGKDLITTMNYLLSPIKNSIVI